MSLAVATGRYTGIRVELLAALGAKVKEKLEGIDSEDLAICMDDALDDIVRFIKDESLLASLFDNLVEVAALSEAIQRVQKECTVTDVFGEKEITDAISSSDHISAANNSDIIAHVKSRYSPGDVFSEKELGEWATDNGYEITPEERIYRAHS